MEGWDSPRIGDLCSAPSTLQEDSRAALHSKRMPVGTNRTQEHGERTLCSKTLDQREDDLESHGAHREAAHNNRRLAGLALLEMHL